MKVVTWGLPGLVSLVLLLTSSPLTQASSRQVRCWNVDDLRAGMKGQGKTVVKGTKIETFAVEVLGVLKNTSPGRDMVLARLSGLDLDRTGVIAGMSGSPVYIEGKLVGAVAYAWPFGKEPLAGITPFAQMHGAAEAYEQRDLAERRKPRAVGLRQSLHLDGKSFDRVSVAQAFDDATPVTGGDLRLVPLRTPLAATNISTHTLNLLSEKLRVHGMVPINGGGVSARVAHAEKDVELQPGSALSVALIQGDFDLSGIGTVTHIEGKRVYGWGHPFMSLGGCDFPLMTGYVHTICSRQNLSFKMGSPLRNVGVINADVSTCIAGWLDREPDLLPMKITVIREPGAQQRTFRVKLVRQRNLLSNLVFTALSNSLDTEGELPEELTAQLSIRINIEGQKPLVVDDVFSGGGISGGRAPVALFAPIISMLTQLTFNPHEVVRFEDIECSIHIRPGRKTAEIESVELESTTCAPGETLRGMVFLRPHKGLIQRLPIRFQVPADFPEGEHTLTVSDDISAIRARIRDNPTLLNPASLEQVLEGLRLQAGAKRTHVVLRVPRPAAGVALAGKALPDLPPSMVHILSSTRRTGTQTISDSLVSHHASEWVVQGSDTIRFHVTREKRTSAVE